MTPPMQITSDEINCLIYSYLQDSGFHHTAFSLRAEGRLDASPYSSFKISRGELVDLLSKSLLYTEVEAHWQTNASTANCRAPFSLLQQHTCSDNPPNSNRGPLIPVAATQTPRRPLFVGDSNGLVDGIGSAQKRKSRGDDNDLERVDKRARMDDSMEIVSRTPALPDSHPSATNGFNHTGIEPLPEDSKMESEISEVVEPVIPKVDPVYIMKGHAAEVFVCSWNPHFSNKVATGSRDATVLIWTVGERSGQPSSDGTPPPKPNEQVGPPIELRHLPPTDQSDVTSMDWNPQGTLLATGSYDSVLRIWQLDGEIYLRQEEANRGPLFALKFSRTGKLLLSASLDGTACVWDVESKSIYKKFQVHKGCCLDVDWLDDDTFASCSADKLIHLISLDSTEPFKTYEGHTNEINQIKFNDSRTLLASCSDDRTARIWDIRGWEEHAKNPQSPAVRGGAMWTLEGHTDSLGSINWCPSNDENSQLVASSSFDCTARLWDALTGACLKVFDGSQKAIFTLNFSPKGKYLVTGSGDGNMNVYLVKTQEKVWTWYSGGPEAGIFEVEWQQNDDGQRMCICLENEDVGILDISLIPELQE